MGLEFDPWAMPMIIAGALELAAAVFAFFVAPWRALNRFLGLALAFEGVWAVVTGAFQMVSAADSRPAFGLLGVQWVAIVAMAAFYPLFLSEALDAWPVRWFRRAAVRGVYLLLVGCFLVAWVLARRLFQSGLRFDEGLDSWESDPGPLTNLLYTLVFAQYGLGLLAALVAYRQTRSGTLARQRARAFLLAFGIRDGTWVFVALLAVATPLANDPDTFYRASIYVMTVVIAVSLGLFAILLVYGILRHQLFDLDMKLRWTIRHGTVGTILVAAFLVVAQLVEGFAVRAFAGAGWIVAAVATGLLLFFLTPLQRFGDRVSRRILPTSASIKEAPLAERLALYRDQLRIAWKDGSITAKERQLLEAARTKLGVPAEEAARLERRLLAR